MDLARLRDPFPAEEVEWRLAQCGKSGSKIWARCLAYITNRAIMGRLDDVCGPANWKNEYREWGVGGKAGVLCGISIRMECGIDLSNPGRASHFEWVTKWDGSEQTDIEAVKGGLSDSMKRAAVHWGIGRYLYDLEEGWAQIVSDDDKGAHRGQTKDREPFRWRPPQLPAWALPKAAPTQPAAARKTEDPAAEALKDFAAAKKAVDAHRKSNGLGPATPEVVAEALSLRGWDNPGFRTWGELRDALGVARFRQLTRAMDANPLKFEKEASIIEEGAE